jgi:hypothetical protein
MWNLTSYDIHRIIGQLQARRARIDAKYAEESKALDAEFTELETLERVAASVALKYDDAANTSEENSATAGEEFTPVEVEVESETEPVTAPADHCGGADVKTASRWRLALCERPSTFAPEYGGRREKASTTRARGTVTYPARA